MGKIQVVVGGQFGSEGKGAVAAHLADPRHGRQVALVRVAGPNAGHSAIHDGVKWALRQIPVGAVVNHQATLVIGAGSEIDEEVLFQEIQDLESAGIPIRHRLVIDPEATVIEPEHREREAMIASGTTGKGIGAARAARCLREAARWADGPPSERQGLHTTNTAEFLERFLIGGDVIIEGTQGFALGSHAGFYPYCTSSDCRAVDFLAMAGISPWSSAVTTVEPWVCLRTYPIRIAGNSGPMLQETSWEELSRISDGYIQPEYTTVTKKLRRVGLWDPMLAQAGVAANGGEVCRVALTFFDYLFPELAGVTDPEEMKETHWKKVHQVQSEVGAPVVLLGTGPDTCIKL